MAIPGKPNRPRMLVTGSPTHIGRHVVESIQDDYQVSARGNFAIPYLHIVDVQTRRLPFLAENLKNNPVEWNRRNNAILKRERPSIHLRIQVGAWRRGAASRVGLRRRGSSACARACAVRG